MAYGIIDSGLGGYRIYQALQRAYKEASFVFLADQKNAPYGNKTKEELFSIASTNMQWFLSLGITKVIIGCNTMNATILDDLKQAFKQIQFFDVVNPTVENLKCTHHQNWLILATHVTTQSKIYEHKLQEQFNDAQITSIELPKLVTYIEDMVDSKIIQAYLKECIPSKEYDAILLGCTHYPLVSDLIENQWKAKVYDSEEAIVKSLENEVFDLGESSCYTSADASFAQKQAQQLFGITEHFKEKR